MKIIFVTKHNIHLNVLKGGEIASKANYDVLVEICGKKNIEILEIKEKEKLLGKYIQYLFKRDGYDKYEECRLCQYINERPVDIIFFDGSWFGSLANKINTKSKIIVFLHNVEKKYSLDRIKRNKLTAIKYWSVAYNERQIIARADYIFALNNRDSNLIKEYYKRECDLLLPISIKDTFCPKNQEVGIQQKKNLLFVGSYFQPNVDGISWFIQEVVSKIECSLVIIGKGMEKAKYLENERVSVLGTVENTEEYYVCADAVVMPIFSGGGMKVKTAEAMMYGKKILATHEALTGYCEEKIDGIFECNTVEEYINVIDNMDNQKYKQNIRNYFLNNFSYEINRKRLEVFFHECMS